MPDDALFTAVRNGDVAAVAALLEAGADVESAHEVRSTCAQRPVKALSAASRRCRAALLGHRETSKH